MSAFSDLIVEINCLFSVPKLRPMMVSSKINVMNRESGRTKEDMEGMKMFEPHQKLNDIAFRVVLIPFFGIAIPLLTKMISYQDLSSWRLKASFLFTIGIAWIIWEGNRFLLFTLRNYFDWYDRPIRKILALLLAVPFYTIPVSVILLAIWFRIFTSTETEWSKVWLATALILICVLFIVHVYETVFLVKEAESEKLANARLEKSKAVAELQALKSQIDPHFIFNSLNTLSHFIDEDPPKAKAFNQKLSDVYRYILHKRDKDLVLLAEELDFVKDYFSMLKIRYADAVKIKFMFEESSSDQYLVLPISLQILVENALKHNVFSDEKPLLINVFMREDALVVENEYRPKKKADSSKVGLANLLERSKLLIGKAVHWTVKGGVFSVELPMIRI
jgi:sensor histidine kinase YesM